MKIDESAAVGELFQNMRVSTPQGARVKTEIDNKVKRILYKVIGEVKNNQNTAHIDSIW